METKPVGTYQEIPIENIIENPENARTVYDETKLSELAQSIKSSGIQQLPVVTAVVDRPGVYMLESGHRRRRAVLKLGWPMLPCIVKTRESVAESSIASLAENIQREDLTTYDVSVEMAKIKDVHKLSPTTIAKMLGMSASYAGVLIRLQEDLSDEVKALWKAGNPRATVDYLRNLAKVPKVKQIEAFKEPEEGEEGEEKESEPREKKRNLKRAAEQLMAAMLKMSADDVKAVNAKECVAFILGGRTKKPVGITFEEK